MNTSMMKMLEMVMKNEAGDHHNDECQCMPLHAPAWQHCQATETCVKISVEKRLTVSQAWKEALGVFKKKKNNQCVWPLLYPLSLSGSYDHCSSLSLFCPSFRRCGMIGFGNGKANNFPIGMYFWLIYMLYSEMNSRKNLSNSMMPSSEYDHEYDHDGLRRSNIWLSSFSLVDIAVSCNGWID